jgi:hypothetical protein
MKLLIPIAVIIFGFAQQPSKSLESKGISEGVGSQVSQQSNRDERNNSSLNIATSVMEAIAIDDHPGPSDENVDIQKTLAKYTELLVFVGLITAIAITWQSYETRRNADFTKRSVESAMNKERARVEIMAADVILDTQGGNSGVGVTLKNSGPTMAFLEEGMVRLLMAGREVEPNYAECINLGFVGTLAERSTTPNQRVIFLQPESILTQAQILEIRQEQSFIHFYGFVRYRDVYDRIHKVRIHLRWVMRWGLQMQGQIMEWWELSERREENSDTEEKSPKKSWAQRLDDGLDRISSEKVWLRPK